MKLKWTPARRRAALLGAWVLATALVVVCALTVDWTRAAEVLVAARPSWIALAVLANATIVPLTALFWTALRPQTEDPVSFRTAFEIAATAIAVMNAVPFGAGHVSMVLLWIQRGNTTQRGALSVLALDQLGEGLAKVALFLLVGLLAPMPAWMRAGVTTATLLVAALILALGLASRWLSELRIDRSWSRTTSALAWLVLSKLAEAFAIVAAQRAFGIDVGISGTVLVLAAASLGSMIPVTPGNAGTYEAAVFVAYRHLGLTPEQALSVALVQHICYVLPSVGIGYLFVSAQTVARSAIASR